MTRGTKKWVRFIVVLTIAMLLILFALHSVISHQVTTIGVEVDRILREDERFSAIQTIPIHQLQEYSGQFDTFVDTVTADLPSPLNAITQTYIDSIAIRDYRTEFSALELSTAADIIPLAIAHAADTAQRYLEIAMIAFLVFGAFIVLILVLHDRSEDAKIVKDDQALAQGKVIL